MPRKIMFSGKQKKKQLQEKRFRKQDGPKYLANVSFDDGECGTDTNTNLDAEMENGESISENLLLTDFNIQKIHDQPEKTSKAQSRTINSFCLHFFKESDEAIEKRKKEARKPLKSVEKKHMEMAVSEIYPSDILLDFPKRPSWNYSMSKEKLDAQEQCYFKEFVSLIIGQKRSQELAYFELNLETWRQLWRVLELSDILLIICDARHPALHLPPSLIQYLKEDLKKNVIIILNKIDLLPPLVVSLWKSYLESQFLGASVILFSSFLKEMKGDSDFFSLDPTHALNKKRCQIPSLHYGPAQLYNKCLEIVKDKVDLSFWRMKLIEDGLLQAGHCDKDSVGSHSEDDMKGFSPPPLGRMDEMEHDPMWEAGLQMDRELLSGQAAFAPRPLFHHGVLSLGCIGFPNAGKSSVLNTLVNRKVVSVSQTPGHTKHFQTIFLTPTVKLCDCPGLVFPSLIPKSLQVVAGIYPVAHVREPYSVVAYLAKRLDLPSLLHLLPPDHTASSSHPQGYVWSAYSICEAWALKNRFRTSKAGRPDLYRAANKILRMVVDGQICLYFQPPNSAAMDLDKAKTDPSILYLQEFLRNPPLPKGTIATKVKEEDEEDDNYLKNSSGEEDEEEEEGLD